MIIKKGNRNYGTSISYIYNAAGQKISKYVDSEALDNTVKHVEYLDGFQYTGGVLNFFPHAEGYVNVTSGTTGKRIYNYVYNYTDHLGNIRLSYTKDAVSNQLKIMEENHYYPFGLKHQKYTPGGSLGLKAIDEETARPSSMTSTPYAYKYNGQEWQDELGLGLYDYGARNYDPAIGRWHVIDPLAEMSRKTSPYVYALNNPVFFIDPDGMMAESFGQDDVILKGSQSGEAFNQLQSAVQDELTLSMDDSGKLSYIQKDPSATLSQEAQNLTYAIDDKSIQVNVYAENSKQTSSGNLMVGGAMMGNIIGNAIDASLSGLGNTAIATQEVNPSVLGTMSDAQGTPGVDMLHEVTEAYNGAILSMNQGVSSPNSSLSGSVYNEAHVSATPQSAPVYERIYDARGNEMKMLPGNKYPPGVKSADWFVNNKSGNKTIIQTLP